MITTCKQAEFSIEPYGRGSLLLHGMRSYNPVITVRENAKGVLDVDTVKGCTLGMKAYPNGGCYGECYASKTASFYGFDFKRSVTRRLFNADIPKIFCTVRDHPSAWYRIGTFGDPCHAWEETVVICETLRYTKKNSCHNY